jgi:hypothetical protein
VPQSNVFSFDPLVDRRWPDFVRRHPAASVFHTQGWLRALQRTYGYEPIVFTTSHPDSELRNAIVLCAVRSWLTGNRLVSLPFSDHCEPLLNSPDDLNALMVALEDVRNRQGWKYVELRPADSHFSLVCAFEQSETFLLHRIDLTPSIDVLFKSFHKDCVQRKIRRAEREKLVYESGRDEELLRRLYPLLVQTRQRHRMPPQPYRWFHNLLECCGEDVCIRLVSKGSRPVAGIVTLQQERKAVYKYGGSDIRQHNLGGMPFLLWRTIQEAKQSGSNELDLGRSDLDNAGLIAFKDHWTQKRSRCEYWRSKGAGGLLNSRYSKRLRTLIPSPILSRLGPYLYTHIG